MSSTAIFSSQRQLQAILKMVVNYARLPFATDSIPGAFLEGALANIHQAQRLGTYDFVDVVKRDSRVGWQVKSTKASTPVTWKRAKIPDSQALIRNSRASDAALQELGAAIIAFCNAHAKTSLEKYELDSIGYSRLIVSDDGTATYFERVLITRQNPVLFDPEDFVWRWSAPKQTTKKEQLCALHGTHQRSGKKWFAWHGLGENQLHFSGERDWWPTTSSHSVTFKLPEEAEKIDFETFAGMLAAIGNGRAAARSKD